MMDATESTPLLPATLADDEGDDHGRIGYGRYGRYTPLALAAVLILALLAIGIARWQSGGAGNAASPGTRSSDLPGTPAPDGTLNLLDGGQLRLADARAGGAVLVVNFWASWCAPCTSEAPIFERIRTAGAVDGVLVQVVGVGVKQDNDTDARAFVRDMGITYPVGRDTEGTDGPRGPIQAVFGQGYILPMTIVIRPDGIVASVHVGQIDESTPRSAIRLAGQ